MLMEGFQRTVSILKRTYRTTLTRDASPQKMTIIRCAFHLQASHTQHKLCIKLVL